MKIRLFIFWHQKSLRIDHFLIPYEGMTPLKMTGTPSRVRYPKVSVEHFTRIDSASNRYEYQDYFRGCKDGRCVGLTTVQPSCVDCLEILEPQPSGTLTACTGTAYPVSYITLAETTLVSVYQFTWHTDSSSFYVKPLRWTLSPVFFITILFFLIFSAPYIVIHICEKDQHDAHLFLIIYFT
jgi:hypothetical protein